MSEVRWSTRDQENIVKLCRCGEERSNGWWKTNYGRVIWTNRMWASALRSSTLRTEWWSVQRLDNMSPCRQTASPNNIITQMLLISHLSVIFHFHHFSCTAFSRLVLSSALPFSSMLTFFFVLPLTPVAVELLIECWAGEISPAVDLFVGPRSCCFLFLSSHCLCGFIHFCLTDQIWWCITARLFFFLKSVSNFPKPSLYVKQTWKTCTGIYT